jgi:50S ribosomal protein L16 3-hydroxylase
MLSNNVLPSLSMKSVNKKYPVLGAFTQKEFLSKYWQKRPLLIRNAFSSPESVITPDELAGMCCDEGIESRLILEKGGKHPWELRRGPFKPSTFKKLPKTHWTFLVNGVDRFVPSVNAVLDSFSFIPFWRIDDVMFSYAVDKGNVGAHVDNYDVFLVQMYGTRRWMIEDRPVLKDDFVPNLPIRLLKKFKPTHTWDLQPGDMLYLPPRFPHHGIAVGTDCVTMSVGFRAPSFADFINGVASEALSKLDDSERYTDPDLQLQHPGEISAKSLTKVRKTLQKHLLDPSVINGWLGRYITEPNSDVTFEPAQKPKRLTPAAAHNLISKAERLVRVEGVRLAFIAVTKGEIEFFANGASTNVSGACARLAVLLSEKVVTPAKDVLPFMKDAECAEFLGGLIQDGLLDVE